MLARDAFAQALLLDPWGESRLSGTTIMPRPVRLFVYGLLMRGEPGAQRLATARYVTARTVAGFRLVDLGEYPGMVVGGSGTVAGELYQIDGGLLPGLDAFEGHPELFVRSIIALQSGLTAEAYILRPEHARGRPTLAEGDWRQRARGRVASQAGGDT